MPSDTTVKRDIIRERIDVLRLAIWGIAAALAAAALLADPGRVWPAARTTIGPFATLAALIAAGMIADRLGVFLFVARRLISPRATPRATFAAVLVFAAVLSGLVNLDVAVVVALPVALRAARLAGLSPSRLCLATAFTANAASFLLPTSNLTTLLVLSRAPLPLATYVRESWVAWLLVTAVTVWGLTRLLAGRHEASARTDGATRLTARGLLDLAPLFVWATAVRALLGAGLALQGRFAEQVAAGAVLAAAVDNLPAAAAVHATGSAGAWAAILAMAVGPNLIVTGSIATLISRRLARDDGVPFSAARFSLLGVAVVPVQVLAATAGLLVTGALR